MSKVRVGRSPSLLPSHLGDEVDIFHGISCCDELLTGIVPHLFKHTADGLHDLGGQWEGQVRKARDNGRVGRGMQ